MLPTTAPQFSVSIRCHVGWQLLQEYNDSANHDTTIARTVEEVQGDLQAGTTPSREEAQT